MQTYAVFPLTDNGCYSCKVNPCTQVLHWETTNSIPAGLLKPEELLPTYVQGFCDYCMDKQLTALLTLDHARLLKVVDIAIGEEEGDWE